MMHGAFRGLVVSVLLVVQALITVLAQPPSASPSAPPAAIPLYLREFRPIPAGKALGAYESVVITRFYDPGPRVLCYLHAPETIKWVRECPDGQSYNCYVYPGSSIGSISCVRLSDADFSPTGVPSVVEPPVPTSQKKPAK